MVWFRLVIVFYVNEGLIMLLSHLPVEIAAFSGSCWAGFLLLLLYEAVVLVDRFCF